MSTMVLLSHVWASVSSFKIGPTVSMIYYFLLNGAYGLQALTGASRISQSWFGTVKPQLLWHSEENNFICSQMAPAPHSGSPCTLGAMHGIWGQFRQGNWTSMLPQLSQRGQKMVIIHNLQLLSSVYFFNWDKIMTLSVWREWKLGHLLTHINKSLLKTVAVK